MMILIFKLLHIMSLLFLVGALSTSFFFAFANQDISSHPIWRRNLLMIAGIASLVLFLTGFGMLGMMKLGVPGWAIVKLVCFLVLGCLPGLVLRKTQSAKMFLSLSVASITIAIVLVLLKPTF